jgi:hypothetical protein
MDVKGYISEVCNDPIIGSIDAGDEFFLERISEGFNSAYKIYKDHQRFHSISYKNVHQRVQKLLKYALIEEVLVPGGLKHGAKNYRLKTRGIVYIFTELLKTRNFTIFILSHQANILFKTFLEPFLETRTIKAATYSLSILLANYITECCEITRNCINLAMDYSYDDKISVNSDFFNIPPIAYMYYRLNSSIQSFIVRSAVLDIDSENYMDDVINKAWRKEPLPSEGKILCLAHDRDQTQSLLSKDRKFMKSLREVEYKFRIGFDALSDPIVIGSMSK